MNILLITHFVVGFMVSEIPRVSVFGYFPLIQIIKIRFNYIFNLKYMLYYIFTFSRILSMFI